MGGTHLLKRHQDKGELGLAMHAQGFNKPFTQGPKLAVGDLILLERAHLQKACVHVSRTETGTTMTSFPTTFSYE